jgi:peptidoglycan/LPS O-acetylase OafA/YrhL
VKRNQSLDVLRSIAVIAVIGGHFHYYSLWTRIGGFGVDLFFVLSGFLISGLLFKDYKNTGRIHIRRFLIRRGLKIWPSYYLLMMGAAVLFVFGHAAMSKSQLLANIFFVQNYIPGYPFYTIFSHTWTLAIEEHFYLLLPFLFLLLVARGRTGDPFRAIPMLALIIAITCFSFRAFELPPHIAAWNTHMRIDELFGGVALAYLHHFKIEIYNRLTGNYALVLAALLIFPTTLRPYTGRAMQTIGLTSLTLAFILIVAWSVVRSPKGKYMQLFLGGAARIGVYSCVFVLHLSLAHGFRRFVRALRADYVLEILVLRYLLHCGWNGNGLSRRDAIPAASRSIISGRICRGRDLETVIRTYRIS